MTAVLIAIGAVAALVVVVFFVLFNRLIRLRNKTDAAWHQIDVELNRRHDLVPGLEQVVKGYAGHEESTFEDSAKARVEAETAGTVREKGPAEEKLTGAIGNIIAVGERYPTLKADEEFKKFARQLSETEARIAGSRKYYNGSVMYYENAREGFPGNIVAAILPGTFSPRDYFEIKDPADRHAPSINNP
jgi:LemA protein